MERLLALSGRYRAVHRLPANRSGALAEADGRGAGGGSSSSGTGGASGSGSGKGGDGNGYGGSWGVLILLGYWFAGFVTNLLFFWLQVRLKHYRENELPRHHQLLCRTIWPLLLPAIEFKPKPASIGSVENLGL